MIERLLKTQIESRLGSGKVILLMGARQTGKTTLLKGLFARRADVLWLSGDEPDIHALFENLSAPRFAALAGGNKVVVIDEAQRIANIGLRLKLIADQLPGIQLVVTGSSSFELANILNEPMTGRKWEYLMYPLSCEEMIAHHGLLEERRLMPHRLVFGYYPEVVSNPGDEKEILRQLSDSYLYKDVLSLNQIKKPDAVVRLLQALAYQVGSQVSWPELAQACGLDYKTAEKYVRVLEQAYVIFCLGSFSRNLRNELKKSRKVYFFDNGIRNACIANFSQIENRSDIGALWENFLVSERVKYSRYHCRWANGWFWRTQSQREIDYVEEEDGKISAFEFKWNPSARVKLPEAFAAAYPGSSFQIIHRDNFEGFVSP